jgi:hypothetical protein
MRCALAITVAVLAIAGCAAGATPSPAPPAFSVTIYNRTEAVVAVGPAVGVSACSEAHFPPGYWNQNAPLASGAVELPVQFSTPVGYAGVVSIVVTTAGAKATVGPIDAGALPACQGVPTT